MSDCCPGKTLHNVFVQENGIIRDNSGLLIARTIKGIELEHMDDGKGWLEEQRKQLIDEMQNIPYKEYDFCSKCRQITPIVLRLRAKAIIQHQKEKI